MALCCISVWLRSGERERKRRRLSLAKISNETSAAATAAPRYALVDSFTAAHSWRLRDRTLFTTRLTLPPLHHLCQQIKQRGEEGRKRKGRREREGRGGRGRLKESSIQMKEILASINIGALCYQTRNCARYKASNAASHLPLSSPPQAKHRAAASLESMTRFAGAISVAQTHLAACALANAARAISLCAIAWPKNHQPL